MSKDKLTLEEIESGVKKVICEATGIKEEKITSNLDLVNELGVDSFTAIELIYNAEDKFNVSISSEEMAGLATVGDIIKIVQEKLK